MSGGTTSARAVPRLAWSLWALSVPLTVFALLLLILNLNQPGVHVYDYWLENTLGALLFSTVGAIVGSRRSQNPVGLDSLSNELVWVVRETVRPAHTSMWLRRPEKSP
jgi:hypothetical protein